MLKNILKLEGAQKLSKNEQKEINGGNILPIGIPTRCRRGNGNDGQSCSVDSPCTGPGNPECFNGCCNIWV
jgi:hypothetical protein